MDQQEDLLGGCGLDESEQNLGHRPGGQLSMVIFKWWSGKGQTWVTKVGEKGNIHEIMKE